MIYLYEMCCDYLLFCLHNNLFRLKKFRSIRPRITTTSIKITTSKKTRAYLSLGFWPGRTGWLAARRVRLTKRFMMKCWQTTSSRRKTSSISQLLVRNAYRFSGLVLILQPSKLLSRQIIQFVGRVCVLMVGNSSLKPPSGLVMVFENLTKWNLAQQ